MKICGIMITYYPDATNTITNILQYFPFTAFQLFYKF